jgi:hypothetical protein
MMRSMKSASIGNEPIRRWQLQPLFVGDDLTRMATRAKSNKYCLHWHGSLSKLQKMAMAIRWRGQMANRLLL